MSRYEREAIIALESGVVDAIDAMLTLDEIIREKDLSMKQVVSGLRLAISVPSDGDDGIEGMMLSMAIVSSALEVYSKEQEIKE